MDLKYDVTLNAGLQEISLTEIVVINDELIMGGTCPYLPTSLNVVKRVEERLTSHNIEHRSHIWHIW